MFLVFFQFFFSFFGSPLQSLTRHSRQPPAGGDRRKKLENLRRFPGFSAFTIRYFRPGSTIRLSGRGLAGVVCVAAQCNPLSHCATETYAPNFVAGDGSVSEAVYRTVDKRGHFAAPSQPRSVAESPYWGKACTTGEAKVAAPNCPRQGPPPETIPQVTLPPL